MQNSAWARRPSMACAALAVSVGLASSCGDLSLGSSASGPEAGVAVDAPDAGGAVDTTDGRELDASTLEPSMDDDDGGNPAQGPSTPEPPDSGAAQDVDGSLAQEDASVGVDMGAVDASSPTAPDAASGAAEPDASDGGMSLACDSPERVCGGRCIAPSQTCDGQCAVGYHVCSDTCVPDSPASICGAACGTLHGPELAVVSGGTALIGSEDLPNTQPVINVEIGMFCIDVTEVTVTQYRECVDAGACQPPSWQSWPGCRWEDPEVGDHPINCVDQARAQDFCAWAGKRLPSEIEWEYAARGPEGRLFPWGDELPNSTRLNYANQVAATAPVGSFPAGATPEGVVDLAGNVWEWTASEWCETYAPDALCTASNYVARGGSWGSAFAEFVRASWRDPDNAADDRFGFRCLLDNR